MGGEYSNYSFESKEKTGAGLCVSKYVHGFLFVCMYICLYVYVNMRVYAYVYMYMCACMCVCCVLCVPVRILCVCCVLRACVLYKLEVITKAI